jgi:isopropylmalate/homocitrate/citramalate synthase
MDEILNRTQNQAAPFTISAFAHKGGLHVAAVIALSYQHVAPEEVGNENAFDFRLSGR